MVEIFFSRQSVHTGSCKANKNVSTALRHSSIPPTSSEGSHRQQEEELKALLPLWKEDRPGHQLRVQVQALTLLMFDSKSNVSLFVSIDLEAPL